MFYALPPGCECGTARVPAPKCSRLPIQLRIRAPGVPGEMRVAVRPSKRKIPRPRCDRCRTAMALRLWKLHLMSSFLNALELRLELR